MRLASLTGMEKPEPMLPDWVVAADEVLSTDAMATLTPMTCPAVFSSGPPELPGLIVASVCRTLMLMLP